ncbi:MAG: hypothetical protein Q4A21_00750 [bacterium]|nr:hypothetical protein [bacterium]
MNLNRLNQSSQEHSPPSDWDFDAEVEKQQLINEEIARRQEDQARYDDYMESQRQDALESVFNSIDGSRALESYAHKLRWLEISIDNLGKAVMSNKTPGQDKLIAEHASALAEKANIMRRVIDEKLSKIESLGGAAKGRVDILRDHLNDIIEGRVVSNKADNADKDIEPDNKEVAPESGKDIEVDPETKKDTPTAQDMLDAKFKEFLQAKKSGELKDFESVKKMYDDYHEMAYNAIQNGEVESGYAQAQFGAFMDEYKKFSNNNLSKNGEISYDEIKNPENSKESKKFLSGFQEEWQKAYDRILEKDSFSEEDIDRLIKLRNTFRKDGIFRSTVNGRLDEDKFKPFKDASSDMFDLENKLRDKLLAQDKDPDLKNFGQNLPAEIKADPLESKEKEDPKEKQSWRSRIMKWGGIAMLGAVLFGAMRSNSSEPKSDDSAPRTELVTKTQAEEVNENENVDGGFNLNINESNQEKREKLSGNNHYDEEADPYFAQHPGINGLFDSDEIKESRESLGLNTQNMTPEEFKEYALSEDNPAIIQEFLMTEPAMLEAFGLTAESAEKLFDDYRREDEDAFNKVAEIRKVFAETFTQEGTGSLDGEAFNSVYLKDVNGDGSDLNFAYASDLNLGGTTRIMSVEIGGVKYTKELRDQCGGQIVFRLSDGTIVEIPPYIKEIPAPTPTPPNTPPETPKNPNLKPQDIKDSSTVLDAGEQKNDVAHDQDGYKDQTPDVSPGTESKDIDAGNIDNSPRVDVDKEEDQGANQAVESDESRQQDLQNKQGEDLQRQGENNAEVGENTQLTDIGGGIKIDQQGNVYLPDGSVVPYNGN